MRHKLTATALALLLTLALAVPALAGNTGCPTGISARLNDTTLDHSQGMTFIIVPGELRDEHSFYGHTGTTKRAAPADPAPTASTYDTAVAALVDWLLTMNLNPSVAANVTQAMEGFQALFPDEDEHIAGIYSLIGATPDGEGVYGGSSFFEADGSEYQYTYNPATGSFRLAQVYH